MARLGEEGETIVELLTAARDAETSPPPPPNGPWSNVPWRTIIAAIALVVAVALAVVIGALAVFVIPVRAQLTRTITDLPGTVSAAAEGRGPVGHIVAKLHLENLVRDNKDTLDRAVNRLKGSSFDIARSLLVGIFTAVTIFVLTFFLTQSKAMSSVALRFVPRHRRSAVSRAASDAAAAVSGYMIGNLLISLVAGLAAFICLEMFGFLGALLAIPLAGATQVVAKAVHREHSRDQIVVPSDRSER